MNGINVVSKFPLMKVHIQLFFNYLVLKNNELIIYLRCLRIKTLIIIKRSKLLKFITYCKYNS
jgi:hypothetical protein